MIFYFSGTGNSKWVANQLASTLNDRLISIGECMKNCEFKFTLAPGERIGWVFPIHSWGPAPIVLEFISKMHLYEYSTQHYCYMVCSCGDDIGLSVEMWRKALGGIRGDAAFSIQMPNNYILLPGFDVDDGDSERAKLNSANKRIEDIALSVAKCRCCEEVVTGKYKWLKSKLVYPIYKKMAMSDKSFSCDTTKCTACGLCERECPVGNIKMQENRPVWSEKCEMCLSCIHRCPVRAIEYGNITRKKGRYHHK
ncbi:MAG: EFR1 family ferrodoxin [Muribaculaceae bacterium]|nr:EFR1 family ferrodoxin [Muribaculaceae bacterium]